VIEALYGVDSSDGLSRLPGLDVLEETGNLDSHSEVEAQQYRIGSVEEAYELEERTRDGDVDSYMEVEAGNVEEAHELGNRKKNQET